MSERAGKMEIVIGRLLLTGVLLSVGCLVIGELWRWISTGSLAFNYGFTGHSIAGFLADECRALRGGEFRPRFFANMGIALLLLTPYARVVVSLFYFLFIERNPKYIFFTSFVLAVLTYSLFAC